MMAWDGYLPVPTISREWNVRPAITNGESVNLPATHEVHDLDGIAFIDDDLRVGLALYDGEVVLHSDASRIDVESGQEASQGNRLVELEAFAVECDDHCNQITRCGVE